MKTYSRWSLQVIWVMFLMTSCVSGPSDVPELETPAPTNTSIPTDVIVSPKTLEPTAIFTSLPDFGDPGFQPRNINELQSFVMLHLNQGEEVSEIDALFSRADYRRIWLNGRAMDFDGNGEHELFLAASAYVEDLGKIESMFWVAKKMEDQYEVVHSISDIAYYSAKIEFADDFNADSLPDLIFTRIALESGAGADIFVVRFENAKFIIDQVAATDLVINKILAGAADTNGIKNLIITGFEPGWGSSGPGRTVEETYSVTNKNYALLELRYLPDDYRIHVLQDAQIAYNAGDETLAVKLWEQAAHDRSLIDFPSMRMENDKPEIYQPAFALYRLYTYFLSKNDGQNAQTYRAELESNYPEGSPGGEFIALAMEAKHLLSTSQDSTAVCDGIYEFLNSTTENAGFMMQHWYWGDHNLDIVDFCPLPR